MIGHAIAEWWAGAGEPPIEIVLVASLAVCTLVLVLVFRRSK